MAANPGVGYRHAGEGPSRKGLPAPSPAKLPAFKARYPIYQTVSNMQKIATPAEATSTVRSAQQAGRTVVLCHGCFDIVHPGHIRHLQHAARLGDCLVVSITGDAMVDKGTGRPLIPQELRAESLAALDCVSLVVINQEPTALELLHMLRPDVYVKGREYEGNRDPRFQAEKEVVEQYGGRVVFTSGDVVFSSSALIAALETAANPFQMRLRQLFGDEQLQPEAIERVIKSFHGLRVLVVGETIADTYVMCDRPDVASEGPVMTLRPIEYRRFDGGAAIIARHLAAMGARPTLLTALPRSPKAEAMRQRLTLEGIEVFWVDVERPIIEKQRFLVGATKVMKLDVGEPITLDAAGRRRLARMAVEAAERCDAAIIADYGQGLLTSATLSSLCRGLRPRVNLLVGDVSGRRSDLLAMSEMDLLCPSEVELRDALHNYDEGLSAVAWHMLHETRSKAALVTLGDQGLIAFDQGPAEAAEPADWSSRLRAEHVPALAAHAVDPLGCGDSMLAAATLTLAAGGTLLLASVLGSIAAAAQGTKVGNTVIGAAELRRGLQRLRQAQLTWDAEPPSLIVAASHDQLSVANA
jgi:rfaE bifunctional protein kinase chain/domain/rfaE bifunctional protein nucleotidyltransferase chain/domain